MIGRITVLTVLTGGLIAGNVWLGGDAQYAEPFVAPSLPPVERAITLTEQVKIRDELTAAAPSTSSSSTSSSTTTTTLVPSDARCPEWWVVAVGAGWPTDPAILRTLDWIVWRESRCQPDAVGDGSYGLTQLQWNVHSDWIRDLGFDRDELLHPSVNLAVAWHLYRLVDSDPNYRCGFSPWYPSQPGKHWCTIMEEMT